MIKYVLLAVVSLFSVGCSHTSCRIGMGIDYGKSTFYIFEVFEGSPAEKAGIEAGSVIDPIASNWPVSGVAGENATIVVKTKGKRVEYTMKQERMCFSVPGAGSSIW